MPVPITEDISNAWSKQLSPQPVFRATSSFGAEAKNAVPLAHDRRTDPGRIVLRRTIVFCWS